MKTLDDETLEAIAELICGSDAGIGRKYDSPGLYRSMREIHTFFERAGVVPKGRADTRRRLVLESLQLINGTNSLQQVLLRLASPREYQGKDNIRADVEDHLNDLLQFDGVEIRLLGVEPELWERTTSTYAPRLKGISVLEPPDFHRLLEDVSLANILSFRWQEALKCVHGEAYLAAVVMMGSILEGVLLYRFEKNPKIGNRAKGSPKDSETGKPKRIREWGLSSMVDVAHEVGWLQSDVKQFSHVLREFRNLVHPYEERRYGDVPDADTCSICWQVVQASVSDLLRID